MTDLEHPDVVAALRRIGSTTPRERVLCPRCTSRWIPTDDDLCRSCTDELRENELARKRRWFNSRRTAGATAVAGAATWLKQELRKGPRPTTKLYPAADAAGIAARTLRRAAVQLETGGIIVRWREGNGTDHRALWALTRHAPGHTTTASDPTDGHSHTGSSRPPG